ncbi:MAG: DUF4838 domain-containing protein, partial [Victivallales bacterium]|nr:DUF4838 domain-containing protein [Victivallales bacterium]
VPDLSQLRLPELNESGAPAFAGRQVFNRYPNWFRDFGCQEADRAFWQWYLRNGFNGATPAFVPKALYLGDEMRWTTRVHFVHNFYAFVPPERYFQEHPEYFSMDRHGKRQANLHRRGTQLCLSNPEVTRIIEEKLLELIRADRAELPQEEWPIIYNITPNDASNSLCQCQECQAIIQEEGGDTGLLLRVLNALAEGVHREFPGIRLLTRGAMGSSALPKTQPVQGVTIYLSDDFTDTSCFQPITETRRQEIRRWAGMFPDLMLWDYWNMGLGTYFSPPRPEVVLDALLSDLRWFRETGIRTLFIEAERDFLIPQNFLDLEFFLLGQLMLEPAQDTERLLSVFMQGYYGQAAPFVREYLEALRGGIRRQSSPQLACAAVRWEFLTVEFMLENYRRLERALEAVQTDTLSHVHVAAECLPLLWSIVYYRNETEKPFAQAGVGIDAVTGLLRQLATETIAHFQPSATKHSLWLNRLDSRLAPLEACLTVPSQFADIAGCKVFAWPHQKQVAHSQCRPVKDADALAGQALLTDFHKSHPIGTQQTRVFTCYDYTEKRSITFTAEPPDEQYHWYAIPHFRVTRNSIFTAHLWMLQIDLSQAWEFPHAGNPEVNDYTVHFRAKFTGPAFFPNSKQANGIYVDTIVLTPELKRDSTH